MSSLTCVQMAVLSQNDFILGYFQTGRGHAPAVDEDSGMWAKLTEQNLMPQVRP